MTDINELEEIKKGRKAWEEGPLDKALSRFGNVKKRRHRLPECPSIESIRRKTEPADAYSGRSGGCPAGEPRIPAACNPQKMTGAGLDRRRQEPATGRGAPRKNQKAHWPPGDSWRRQTRGAALRWP